jgi:hypothetical protein
MLNIFKRKKDFACIPSNDQVKNIKIPVIPLGDYPGVIEALEKLFTVFFSSIDSDETNLEDLGGMNFGSIVAFFPVMVKKIAPDLFEFLAYIFKTDIDTIKALSGADTLRALNKFLALNEIDAIKDETQNFIQALKRKTNQGKM